MTAKKKEIVWHKKLGKLLPSSVLHSHSLPVKGRQISPAAASGQKERMKAFAKNFSAQIKKAVEESSGK
ncbi:MAG: hypothetical protein WC552_02600 [Candidatus Omnitrophota bacterium]